MKRDENRIVDNEITLVGYYPNYKTSLKWYQDLDVVKQVDNRDEPYDIQLLKNMYSYLNERGHLYYIKFKGRLCGDIALQDNGDVAIVVAKPFQNKHIGRRAVKEIIKLAREIGLEKMHAEIYSFNHQSQRMFASCGFIQETEEDHYLELK